MRKFGSVFSNASPLSSREKERKRKVKCRFFLATAVIITQINVFLTYGRASRN